MKTETIIKTQVPEHIGMFTVRTANRAMKEAALMPNPKPITFRGIISMDSSTFSAGTNALCGILYGLLSGDVLEPITSEERPMLLIDNEMTRNYHQTCLEGIYDDLGVADKVWQLKIIPNWESIVKLPRPTKKEVREHLEQVIARYDPEVLAINGIRIMMDSPWLNKNAITEIGMWLQEVARDRTLIFADSRQLYSRWWPPKWMREFDAMMRNLSNEHYDISVKSSMYRVYDRKDKERESFYFIRDEGGRILNQRVR